MLSEEIAPTTLSGEQARVLELYQRIKRSRAKLIGPEGNPRKLPTSLYEFLVDLVASLTEGQSVALVKDDAQVTTVEAAAWLGVSRQFVIKLLERGEIPHHMVGTHRRIYLRDLMAFRAQRDSKRRRILDDLTRTEAEEGLYDLEPAGDRPA